MTENWAEYFRRYDAERAAAKAAKEAPEEKAPIILRTGRVLSEQAIKHLGGSPGAVIKRLKGRGWDVRVGWAKCFMPAVLFASDSEEGAKNAHRKGDVRYPSHELETIIVSGRLVAGGGELALEATWTRKDDALTFRGARTRDPLDGDRWRPRFSSRRPQSSYEREFGVETLDGLSQWLKFAAPTPSEVKKRRQQKEAS